MTENERREIRRQIVAAAALGLEGVPLDARRAARLNAIETYANYVIRVFPLATVDDMKAIFVADLGAGPIGDEIATLQQRLEIGAGPIEREDLVALARGTRRDLSGKL